MIPGDPKTYDLHQHWFRKSALLGATDLKRVPATEITTAAIASSNGAFRPGELLCIDLDGQEDSGEKRDSETHCRGSS
jgi:hypothetical protein